MVQLLMNQLVTNNDLFWIELIITNTGLACKLIKFVFVVSLSV
jgi:hypothetical protein